MKIAFEIDWNTKTRVSANAAQCDGKECNKCLVSCLSRISNGFSEYPV